MKVLEIFFTLLLISTSLTILVPQNPKRQQDFFDSIAKNYEQAQSHIKNLKSSSSTKKEENPIPVDYKSGQIPISGTDGKEKGKMFYLYFPSNNDPKTDPLIVWFTGGPGCASELAAVVENGPIKIVKDKDGQVKAVKSPEGAWNTNANVLYIDNPLGVGFSTLNNKKQPVSTEEELSREFGNFMIDWLNLADFQDLKGRDLYITGESYAGHYVPWVSNHLYNMNNPDINLQGIAIGNGLSNPNLQYKEYTEFSELEENMDYTRITDEQKPYLNNASDLCSQMNLFRNPSLALPFSHACNIMTDIIIAPDAVTKKTQPDATQKFNTYNIKIPCDIPGLCYDFSNEEQFFNEPEVQKALNVPPKENGDPQKFESCTTTAGLGLRINDWWRDASHEVVELLESGIKVLVYSGDLDYICNWKGGESWTYNLRWSGQAAFQGQGYEPVYMYSKRMNEEKPYGQKRAYRNFEFLKVLEAGHMVPMDQPKAALSMINRLIGAD